MFSATALAAGMWVSLAGVELELEKDRIQAEENRRLEETRRSEERMRRDAEQRMHEERMRDARRREEVERQRTADHNMQSRRTETPPSNDRDRPDTSRLQHDEKLGMWVPRPEEDHARREVQERQRRALEGSPPDASRSKGAPSTKSARTPATSRGLEGEVMTVEEAVRASPPPPNSDQKP
jgi:colicin import membrane protein